MAKEKTTEEVTTEEIYKFPNRQSWKNALDNAPNDAWVHSRQLGGNRKSIYIPIQFQQALSDILFSECDVYDEKYTLIANEIVCTVKIQILPSYPNSEHRTISGTGAKPVQCKSGSFPESFPKGKISNALEYNAPAARTAAISNAFTTFGNVFGRNLGRAVSSGYSMNKKNKKSKDGKK